MKRIILISAIQAACSGSPPPATVHAPEPEVLVEAHVELPSGHWVNAVVSARGEEREANGCLSESAEPCSQPTRFAIDAVELEARLRAVREMQLCEPSSFALRDPSFELQLHYSPFRGHFPADWYQAPVGSGRAWDDPCRADGRLAHWIALSFSPR